MDEAKVSLELKEAYIRMLLEIKDKKHHSTLADTIRYCIREQHQKDCMVKL